MCVLGGCLVAVAALAAGDAMAQGCAMCGTVMKDGADPLSRSITKSALFMLSMPFSIFLSVAGWIVYRFRRFNREMIAPDIIEEIPR